MLILTQKEIEQDIPEKTALSTKLVKAVLQELQKIVTKEILKKQGHEIKLKGFLKIKTTKKAAVKGGQKKINPLTKQPYVTKDKPGSLKVSIRPLGAFAKDIKNYNLNNF